MSNENNSRGRTDYMGIAAIGAILLLWQLLEIIKALLIVGGVAAIGFGGYWIWSKIQATKNHQNFMNNMYNNHNSTFNQHHNQSLPHNQNNSLPPNYYTNNHVNTNPQSDNSFKDFEEYQRFKEWQSRNSNTNQRPPYNPYSENYEG